MIGKTTQLYIGNSAAFPGWDNLTLVGSINISVAESPYTKSQVQSALSGQYLWRAGTFQNSVAMLLDRYVPGWNVQFIPSFTAPNFTGNANLNPAKYTGMIGGRNEWANLALANVGKFWFIKLSDTVYLSSMYGFQTAGADIPDLLHVRISTRTDRNFKYGVLCGGVSCPAGASWDGTSSTYRWYSGYGVPVKCTDGVGLLDWYVYDNNGTLRLSFDSDPTRNLGTTDFVNILENGWRPETDPYEMGGIGGDDPIPGGGGVSVPGFPGLTATSAGVIGLFCPSAAQMQLLSDFMWTDFGGTGATVEDILKELVEAVKRTISNPLDYIIGLNIIPSQGLSVGASKVVRFGFVSSGVSMPELANQYFTVDCGALSFDTVCGDTFLDYAPYSKFSIYLPYIGFKDVDPNDFVGHTIGVIYHGDCVTGGVTAYITKDGSVMYQYSGCCALNVPLSADSWGETISGAISVATGIVAAAASGGAAGVGLAAAKGAASVAANPSLLSPQVNHSGAVSGGAGCMGVQYPFVIREAVNYHSTASFNRETGYPAYYYRKFADVSGYTTVLDPHVGNIENATREELNEIESLLESGVIL